MISRYKFDCLPAALVVSFILISAGRAQIAIESGQYFSGDLNTNEPSAMSETYTFFAQPYETVIIRIGHAQHDPYPDFTIHNPNGTTATWTQVSSSEYYLPITNYGWYDYVCSIPAGTTTMTYNCSMLRTPNIPLSYADQDVGTLQNGQSKVGTINVSSDLDAGFFAVTNSICTMQVRMGQIEVNLVPNIKIYSPSGAEVTNDFPTDYRSEITATLTNLGIYTVVCADKFNANGQYALTMVQIPGSLAGTDPDIGPIISGEKKTGTINKPGDLDVASFSAVSGDVVSITLHEVDSDFNPILEFYGPLGQRLVRTTDIFEVCVVISNYNITSNGIYSVICKDKEDRYNVSYTLEMDFMAGSPSLLNLPSAPASISASQGSYSNRIEVVWSAGSGATAYDVWRSYSTNSAIQIYTNLSTTTYSDYDVTAGVHYYYKVKSRNTYGTSTNFSPTADGYCGSSAAVANRKVLFVGIDNYDPTYGASPLYTCTNDVNGMRTTFFLGDPSNRWASTNMTAYTDRQATKTTIQNALTILAAGSIAGDIVVYVHSSHGGTTTGTSSNTFICTYDANYTSVELANDLTRFNTETKVFIIIDACYSGGMFRFGNGPLPPWPFAEETMTNYRRFKAAQLRNQGLSVPKTLGDNIAFMTACDYNEVSYCSDFYSRYMGYLIAGCSIPSVDTNHNGEFSFLELHNYAAVKSAAESPSQHAQTYHPALLESTVARAVGTNVSLTSRIRYNDFDADGASDLAIYNSAAGLWRIGSVHRWLVLGWDLGWGGAGFRPINGDYDGDRATDLAVYSETQGLWKIASLHRWAVILDSASFGGPHLTPVSGDYNGDGIYDAALYQNPEGFWYIIASTGAALAWDISIAGIGFTAVSGDYDGDQISDVALYSPSQGYWYIISMTGSQITWGTYWGVINAIPVSGDYDGDGYSDLAIYQESTGLWYVWSLQKGSILVNAVHFGGPGFLPVPDDYDGDGSCDLVVYQESTGNWYLRNVSGTASATIPFGGPGWIPVLPAW
jgi:hypothetical protein